VFLPFSTRSPDVLRDFALLNFGFAQGDRVESLESHFYCGVFYFFAYNLSLTMSFWSVLVMKYATYLLISLVFVGLGCSNRVRVPVKQPVCVSSTDVEAVMENCSSALMQFGFVVEKYDTEVGYIRTRPLRGGQFFEVWRRDNVGGEKMKEASAHSIRRVAEMELRQDAGKICVECVVNVSRLGIDDEESLMWTKVPEMFTGGSDRLMPNAEKEDIYWVEMGEDELLESSLLRELHK